MKKEIMAIIQNDNYEGRRWIKESEIAHATFEHWSEAGFSFEEMSLCHEGKNENGEEFYSCDGAIDFEGLKTWEEICGITTDWWSIRYWDGNNSQTFVFESYDTLEVKIERLEDPSPPYYFRWNLHITDEEWGKETVFCTTSNFSGSISPFFEEDIESKEIYNRQIEGV